jgi:Ubiquitin-conjugating enzyme
MILGSNSNLKRRLLPGSAVEESKLVSQEILLMSRHPSDRDASKLAMSSTQYSDLPFKVPSGKEIIDLTGSPSSSMSSASSGKRPLVIDLTSGPSTPEKQEMDYDRQMALELQASYDLEFNQIHEPLDSSSSNPVKKTKFGNFESDNIFKSESDMADWTRSDSRLNVDYFFETDNLPDLTLWSPQEAESDSRIAQALQDQFDAENAFATGKAPAFAEQSRALEEENKQSRKLLWDYGQNIIKKRCVCCRKALVLDETAIRAINTASLKSKRPNSIMECPSCKQKTCIGCGKLAPGQKHLHKKQVDKWTMTWCCDEGRLFLIWRLLCHVKSTKETSRLSLPAKLVSSLKSNDPSGKKAGVGYGDNNRGVRRRGPEPAPKIIEVDKSDNPIADLLLAISALLPNWQNENTTSFDTEPPTILRVMLRRSALLDKVAELLRNDSMENVGKRIQLYDKVIRFMQVLSHHPITAQMCYQERTAYPEGSGISAVTFGPEPRGRSRRFSAGDSSLEVTQSLEAIMQPLQLQARTYVKQAKVLADVMQDDIPKALLNLCESIIQLASFLKINAPAVTKEKSVSKSVDLTEWHRENSVEDLPDEEIMEVHHYRQNASSLSASSKGRMKRLMTELATLKTSLPEGIYIRHGTSRLDLMKVLIMGPRDTPYENGVFEFDVFCPGNYPNEPPKVHFKTTGGGIAHFNPNLYPEGKGM